MTSSDGNEGYKAATGADETPSVTHSSVNAQVIVGVVVHVDWTLAHQRRAVTLTTLRKRL